MIKEELFAIVVRHACEVLPDLEAHEFEPTDRLVDLGANSVDRAEIVMMIMESLSLRIPRVELFGVRDIGELVDVLHQKLQAA
jgi:polyketide biosynthesis acyl carrier protein